MGTCGTCAICLAELDAGDEAFLDECYHHFHLQCIRRWAAAQVEAQGPGARPELACPLCRRTFASALFDCHDSAFRREFFAAASRAASGRSTPADGGSGSLALTAAHRRRRAVYSTPLASEQRQRWAGQRLGRVQAHRRDVPEFVSRELQALLLQEDVQLVATHTVGTLTNAANGAGAAGGARPAAPLPAGGLARQHKPAAPLQQPRLLVKPAGPPGAAGGAGRQPANGAVGSNGSAGAPLADVAARVQAAVAPFLGDHAERFAWEVAAFAAASGSSVAAYDRQTLQQDAATAAAAGAAARQQLQQRQALQRQQQLVAQRAGRGMQQQGGSDAEDYDGQCPSSSSGDSKPGRRQRSPEPQRSDSEGYLELLLLQGQARQRQASRPPPQQQQEEAQAEQAAGPAAKREQQERRSLDGSGSRSRNRSSSADSRARGRESRRRHRSSHRKHKRRRRGSSRSCSGSSRERSQVANGRASSHPPNGSQGGELAALRQQALQALEQHKQKERRQP